MEDHPLSTPTQTSFTGAHGPKDVLKLIKFGKIPNEEFYKGLIEDLRSKLLQPEAEAKDLTAFILKSARSKSSTPFETLRSKKGSLICGHLNHQGTTTRPHSL